MGNVNYCECKVASKCKYGRGTASGGTYMCNYLLIKKQPRTKQPNGEIKDGKCGLFEER